MNNSDLAQYRVQRHFADHRALAPGMAIEYAPKGPVERETFDRLRASGVIQEAHPAHYWYDLDRMGRTPIPPNPKAKVALLLAGVLAAAAYWVFVA